MEKKVQLKPETALFVEALQKLLQVEEAVYSGLTETYGEEGGEKMWYKSEVYSLLEDSKREIKLLIGDSLELDMSGALTKPETKETEGVC
jgi:hypothetical protein